MSVVLDWASSPSLVLPWLREFCWDLLPCVAQICFSSSAKTQVGASLTPRSPASFSRSAMRLRADSSAAAISAEIFSISTSTFIQHNLKAQKGGFNVERWKLCFIVHWETFLKLTNIMPLNIHMLCLYFSACSILKMQLFISSVGAVRSAKKG